MFTATDRTNIQAAYEAGKKIAFFATVYTGRTPRMSGNIVPTVQATASIQKGKIRPVTTGETISRQAFIDAGKEDVLAPITELNPDGNWKSYISARSLDAILQSDEGIRFSIVAE